MKQDNINTQRVDRGWDNMQGLLNDQMPKRRRRYLILLFLLVGLGIFLIPNLIEDKGSISQFNDKLEKLVSGTTEKEIDSIIDKSENAKSDINKVNSPVNQTKQNSHEFLTHKINSNENSESSNKRINTKTNSKRTKQKQIIAKISTPNNSDLVSIAKLNSSDNPLKSTPNSKEIIKEKLLDNLEIQLIETIQSDNILCMQCLRILPSIKFSEIIILKKDPVSLSYSLSTGIEHIPDFTSAGYSFSFGIERRISSRIGFSLDLGYNLHNRQIPSDSIPLENTSLPTGADQEIVLSNEFLDNNKFEYLKDNSDSFNSLMLNFTLDYSLSNNLNAHLGFGLDYYLSKLNLEGGVSSAPLLGQVSSFKETETKKMIPAVLIGISYSMSKQFFVNLNYKYTLTDYQKNLSNSLSTNKYALGVGYKF